MGFYSLEVEGTYAAHLTITRDNGFMAIINAPSQGIAGEELFFVCVCMCA